MKNWIWIALVVIVLGGGYMFYADQQAKQVAVEAAAVEEAAAAAAAEEAAAVAAAEEAAAAVAAEEAAAVVAAEEAAAAVAAEEAAAATAAEEAAAAAAAAAAAVSPEAGAAVEALLSNETVATAIEAANLDEGASTLLNTALQAAQDNPEALKAVMDQLAALTQ